MEILGEGTVVFQHHSNPMTVHPFLPAEQNIIDARQNIKKNRVILKSSLEI